jgi:hypothetical protein
MQMLHLLNRKNVLRTVLLAAATAVSLLAALLLISLRFTDTLPPAFAQAGGGVTVTLAFDVTLSRDFSLSVVPVESSVLQGSSTPYRVSASGADGFARILPAMRGR